jgi:hypothetical protein
MKGVLCYFLLIFYLIARAVPHQCTLFSSIFSICTVLSFQFDMLTQWLTDTETALKNFSSKSSLEEKIEQLEKFQVSNTSNLIRIAFNLHFFLVLLKN